MCALFFGEIRRHSWPQRLLLLLLAGLIALVLNFLRTLLLTMLAAHHGIASVELWHDRSGLGTLVAAFVLLWFIAGRLHAPRPTSSTQPGFGPVRPVHQLLVAGCVAWLALVETANWLWFRADAQRSAPAVWTMRAEHIEGLVPEIIPARVRAILKFDRGDAYRRNDSDGMRWWIYSLAWSRQGGGAPLARFHSPEICLPAAGMKVAERHAPVNPVGGDLTFHRYRFDWQGRPVYLFSSFHSSSASGAIQSLDQFDLTWRKRLSLAWAGERPAEQRVFQVLIAGAPSEQAAREAFEQFARQILRKEA